jgi:hypothetical protein
MPPSHLRFLLAPSRRLTALVLSLPLYLCPSTAMLFGPYRGAERVHGAPEAKARGAGEHAGMHVLRLASLAASLSLGEEAMFRGVLREVRRRGGGED